MMHIDFMLKLNKMILHFLRSICGFLGSSALFFILAQVFLRIFFRFAIPWVFELTGIMLVYSSFLGASSLVLEERLVKIEIFLKLFPPKIFYIMFYLTKVVIIIVGIAILYGSIIYIEMLSRYRFATLPITSQIYIYPVIIFAIMIIYQSSLTVYIEINRNKVGIK